jgi:PIN domain nuclease of toxin-antitoxin system
LKSKKGTLKVLLDTSFILPSLGIDIDKEILKTIKKLAEVKAEIYYSRFSILESLWIATKLMASVPFDVRRFDVGLRSVIESGRYKKVEENSRIFSDALKLYMLGHKDMIDNILYTSSLHLNLKLLTVDDELKKFVQGRGLRDVLIFPNQIT